MGSPTYSPFSPRLASRSDSEGLQAWWQAGADLGLPGYDGRSALHIVSVLQSKRAPDPHTISRTPPGPENRGGRGALSGAGHVPHTVSPGRGSREPGGGLSPPRPAGNRVQCPGPWAGKFCLSPRGPAWAACLGLVLELVETQGMGWCPCGQSSLTWRLSNQGASHLKGLCRPSAPFPVRPFMTDHTALGP